MLYAPCFQVEFLGMAGIFGTLISGVQTLMLERQTLANVEWTQSVVLFTFGYALRLVRGWTCMGSHDDVGSERIFLRRICHEWLVAALSCVLFAIHGEKHLEKDGILIIWAEWGVGGGRGGIVLSLLGRMSPPSPASTYDIIPLLLCE